TTTELRELVATPQVAVDIAGVDLATIDADLLDRRTRANVAALADAAARTIENPRSRLHFLFWHRPVGLEGDGRVERVTLERTEPAGPGKVAGTGELTTIDAQLMLRSIGYRGIPLPGVPFDAETGRIPNREGRVVELDGTVR